MARRKGASELLTPLEHKIMEVLWEAGSQTVAEVQGKLGADFAYTTVQTMLGVLVGKQKVMRTSAGRAHAYAAAITREGAIGAALSDVVRRMFGGSGSALLMALIDTRQITPEEVASAAKLIEDRREEEE